MIYCHIRQMIFFIFVSIFLVSCSGLPSKSNSSAGTLSIDSYFEHLRGDEERLRQFFLQMPKGGDIHHHLSGSIQAEDIFDLARTKNLAVRLQDGQLCNLPCEDGVAIHELVGRPDTQHELFNFWTVRGFSESDFPVADHFFNAFNKIKPALLGSEGELLRRLRNQAAADNIQYLETMVRVPVLQKQAARLQADNPWSSNLAVQYKHLMAAGIEAIAAKNAEALEGFIHDSEHLLRCGYGDEAPGCGVAVKILSYGNRMKPLPVIWSELVLAFETANQSKEVVGVNMVAAEHDASALQHYSIQMEMFNFLRKKYPNVNLSLHAGELIPGLVPNENDLSFHISLAVRQAGVHRLGHGVSILRESDAQKTLELMAKQDIAIEILLRSNEVILGVKNYKHPILEYFEAGVPIVIATDDEGIFDSKLIHQYVLLAQRYPQIKYQNIKNMVRNSLEYSFLPGAGLHIPGKGYRERVSECQKLSSQRCNNYVKTNTKAFMQQRLELALAEFEIHIAQLNP